MFNLFLDNIAIFDMYPKLIIINSIEWVFLFPVFFFFYILNVINHDLVKNKKLKWLYLPMLLSIIIHLIECLEMDYSLYRVVFNAKDFLYNLVFGIEEICTYIFNAILLIWSYKVIKKSLDNKNTNVKWVKRLWFFVFFIMLSWIILFLIDVILFESNPQLVDYILFDLYILAIELSLFVYWVAYTGLYKLKLANERKDILALLNKKSTPIEVIGEVTYENDTKRMLVSPKIFSENNSYFLKLEQLLQKQFIYRDPDLSREVVAEKLGISPGYLSQIVNTITHKNFTTYINSYRIEEAKGMILDEQFDKYSLQSIGLESGFKSKSTFYNSFKKETGSTPIEFKNNHK